MLVSVASSLYILSMALRSQLLIVFCLVADTSSGDNGAVPLRLLQAEDDDDDEKRFQADLSLAVRQSLGIIHLSLAVLVILILSINNHLDRTPPH